MSRDLQHPRRVLALVRHTLPTPYKGQPAIVFGASFVFVPTYQARTSLHDSLTFLKSAKEDSVVLVAMPSKPTYSPQPWRGRYLTLLPISGSPDVDRGPLHTFAAAGLPVASKEGRGGDMCMRVKMPSCFRSTKRPKRELMWEPALQRGPLWKNVHCLECNPNGELVKGATGMPLCQELLIHITDLSGKLKYTPTDRGHPMPLTLAACHAERDDYLDLTKTVTASWSIMKEDRQEVAMPPKAGTTPKKKEAAKDLGPPANVGISWVASNQFPGDQRPGASRDNPVHLSDATDTSTSGPCPQKRRRPWRWGQAIGPLQQCPVRNGRQYSGSGRRILQSPSRSHRGDRAGITGRVPDRCSLCESGCNGHVRLAGGGTDRCKPHGGRWHHHLPHASQRHAKGNPGICGSCREGQRRARHSSRGRVGSPETSPAGRWSQRPRSPSPECHLTSGSRPVWEGRRRLPFQHREDPPKARASACSGASDI